MARSPFRSPLPAGGNLRFLHVGSECRVILLASPGQFVTLELHCQAAGSSICVDEDECSMCRAGIRDKRLYSYAPALAKPGSSANWQRFILPIGDPYGQVAERDLRGMMTTLAKHKRQDGTESSLRIKDVSPVAADVLKVIGAEWFDIRPRLLRRFGVSMDWESGAATRQADGPANNETPDGALLSFESAYAARRRGRNAG